MDGFSPGLALKRQMYLTGLPKANVNDGFCPSTQGSGGFRRRWLIRCCRVRAQIADKIPEGSDADT